MRASAEYAVWWLALTAVYLELVTTPTGLEAPVGLVIGAVAAAVAVAARRAFEPPARLPAFMRRAVLLPVDLLADSVTLVRLLLTGRAFSPDCGERDELDLPDDDATRAWAVLLATATPGSVVEDVQEQAGRLVLRRHRLTSHHRATSALESL